MSIADFLVGEDAQLFRYYERMNPGDYIQVREGFEQTISNPDQMTALRNDFQHEYKDPMRKANVYSKIAFGGTLAISAGAVAVGLLMKNREVGQFIAAGGASLSPFALLAAMATHEAYRPRL